MCDMLQSAERSINLATFIYDNDSVGRQVLDILIDKARTGVNVRLLMDGLGSLQHPGENLSSAG